MVLLVATVDDDEATRALGFACNLGDDVRIDPPCVDVLFFVTEEDLG